MKFRIPISSSNLGRLQLIIASIAFGFLGVFGKLAYSAGLSIGELLTFRFALAGLLLWAWFILVHPTWIKISWFQLLISALLGIFGYAVFSTLYFTAIEGVSIALAAMLLYTYPIWVTLISALFKHEEIKKMDWIILAIATMGLSLLLWGHISVTNAAAILAGLGSALCYAIYIVVSGRLQKTIRPITSSLYVITFSALALNFWHQPHFPNILKLTPTGGLAIVGIALVCTILPLTLVLAGLQKMKNSEAALLTMIEPVTATIMGVIIWNESFTWTQFLGAGILIGSLFVKTYIHSSQSETLF